MGGGGRGVGSGRGGGGWNGMGWVGSVHALETGEGAVRA